MFKYLESVLPLKRILFSAALGSISLIIVLLAGINSPFLTSATVAERSLNAFATVGLFSFIFLMSCEEYALFKTKRELENFIRNAKFNA